MQIVNHRLIKEQQIYLKGGSPREISTQELKDQTKRIDKIKAYQSRKNTGSNYSSCKW
jgi:hypothetical protein